MSLAAIPASQPTPFKLCRQYWKEWLGHTLVRLQKSWLCLFKSYTMTDCFLEVGWKCLGVPSWSCMLGPALLLCNSVLPCGFQWSATSFLLISVGFGCSCVLHMDFSGARFPIKNTICKRWLSSKAKYNFESLLWAVSI